MAIKVRVLFYVFSTKDKNESWYKFGRVGLKGKVLTAKIINL